MSEKTFQYDTLRDVTGSSSTLKFNESQAQKGVEDSSDPVFDDALDDSSSSYCTALCSLSDYSESLEDDAHTNCADPQCEASSSDVGGTSSSPPPEITVLIQQLKTTEDENLGASQSEEFTCGLDVFSPVIDPFFKSKAVPSSPKITILNQNLIIVNSVPMEDDPYPLKASRKPWDSFRSNKTNTQTDTKLAERLSTLQPRLTSALNEQPFSKPSKVFSAGTGSLLYSLSSPDIDLLNLNTINRGYVDTVANIDQPLNHSPSTESLKTWDYFKSSKTAQPDTKPTEKSDYLEPRFCSNAISTTCEGNQYSREVGQEQSGTTPKEDLPTHQLNSGEGPNKHRAEGKLDRDGSTIIRMKWEGKVQCTEVEKEQAELSLKARNRKPPAGCISTLTANKQKSGIPPHCYSERILATGHQPSPRSPSVSRRWQKQSRQDVLLSGLLPPKPHSSSRQHCSTADNIKGALSMATKLAETKMEVRCLATQDYARSSFSEANYLDVFSSTCWSSNQLSSDRGFHDWSKEVPHLPVISANHHKNSACSETSSFECIDVALESNEEVNRGAKTVPKRQIQLKKRDTVESYINEKNNSGALQVPVTPSRPRDILQRQHSTPAAFHQDSQDAQTERKQKLQKSLSLDETSSKTKKASCIITTVLSKRMQQEENIRAFDQTFAPMKAYNTTNNNECLSSSANDVCTETTKVNLVTGPLVSCGTSSQCTTRKTQESQTKSSSIKEHISVSSKTQPKPITKHSFNPLFSALGKTEFQESGTEITVSPESEKEKVSASKEAAWLTNQSPGEKLSCDSAKGKAWNSSVEISGGTGKQAVVKTTLEECCTVQGSNKQHNVKPDLITSMEKQERAREGETKEGTQCLPMTGCLARTVGNILSHCDDFSAVKDHESDMRDVRPPGPSVNMGIQCQGKFKAVAPVHVVRDMRSLVKNTYSLSFRGPGEAAQGTEHNIPISSPATTHQINGRGEDKAKGYKQDEKPQVRKVTPPLALDRIRDLNSLHTTPRVCATKSTSLLETHDKTHSAGFTKVRPIIAAKANSCALSKSPEIQDSQIDGCKTNLKQTNWSGMALQSNIGASTEISKNGKSVDSSKLEYEKRRASAEYLKQHLATALQYCPPTASCDTLDSSKPSEQVCPTIKAGCETPGPPPRSQSAPGPPTACILAVAPTPVLSPYFYKPNPLSYQTIPPHMGAISYVQQPLLVQSPSSNKSVTVNGPVPLMRSLSEEVRLLSQPCQTDGNTVQQGPSKKTENVETSLKMPSPDTQQCTVFTGTLGTEVIRGSTGMLYPEVSGGLVQNSCHLLLDPETGRCFYVDMPQLPQRKMLFDPETCQYVEVLLPQQTLSNTVMPSPCAIPFPSLHIPAIYTPQCLPYVQAHPQVLSPPGP